MYMPRAHIDFETGSAAELGGKTGVGVHRYAEDVSTRVWGFRWRIGNEGIVYEWRPGFPDPVALLAHIANGGTVVAHNAGFEREIWNTYVRLRLGLLHWPAIRIGQQDCTLARAAIMTLPMSLGMLGPVVGSANVKADDSAMRKMMKPIRMNSDGTYVWHDDPVTWQANMDYCGDDVRTETDIDLILPPMSAYERQIWELDQEINDRGFRVDIDAVTKAVDVVNLTKLEADKMMSKLTGGMATKCSQPERIAKWINSRGIKCDSFAKGDHEDLRIAAKNAKKFDVIDVIDLRAASSKTSTAKYTRMLQCVCADGRIRGSLQYAATSTSRWAGRNVQPQNMPRVDMEVDGNGVNFLVDILGSHMPVRHVYEMLEIGLGSSNVLPMLSKGLRAMIIASVGKKLIGGDFSNIEGRFNAWYGNEEWKLQAFRDYDAGTGPDLYNVGAAKLTGKDVKDIKKSERQSLGKVPELALGFQGGVRAFVNMAANYLVKPHTLIAPVWATTDPIKWQEVSEQYDLPVTDKAGLTRDEWTACKIIVINWREQHPGIVQGWWDIQDAAIAAVLHPGHPQAVYDGRVHYMSDGGWLVCSLASGNSLFYASPEVITKGGGYEFKIDGEWVPDDRYFPEDIPMLREMYETRETRQRRVVRFWGMKDQKFWVPQTMYGGMQCENIISKTARDLLCDAMLRVRDAGYDLILTVHDELLAEVDQNFGSVDHFKSLMAQSRPWAQSVPVSAAAWEDMAYVK